MPTDKVINLVGMISAIGLAIGIQVPEVPEKRQLMRIAVNAAADAQNVFACTNRRSLRIVHEINH